MSNCVICEKEYEYCPRCNKYEKEPAWKISFDSENCKNIYDACVGYRDGIITKEVAKKKLESCDLTVLESAKNVTKKSVEEIVGKKETSKVNVTEDKVETVTDTKVKAEVVEKAKEEKVEAKTQPKKNFVKK